MTDMNIKAIFKKLFRHRHDYSKPLVSRYISFNTRHIIYECSCGKRHAYEVYTPYGKHFPIKTDSFLSGSDFQAILDGEEFIRFGEGDGIVVLKKVLDVPTGI